MKNLQVIIILLFVSLLSTELKANNSDSTRINFVYDVEFDMNFDNREFSKNKFSPSMTIFGTQLTPSIGVSVRQSDNLSHKVMLGVDVIKDFGNQGDTSFLKEMTFYYLLEKQAGKTNLSLQAGVFSRSEMQAYYSQAFFSDSLKFYDSNIEGILMKFHRPKLYLEVGCDWMGRYSKNARERFMVFSGGSGKIFPFMSLGYSAYMYHYANSEKVKGVVDNILVNPYLKFDFGDMIGMQALSLRGGWIQAMQNDRMNLGHYLFTGGAEVELDVRHWNVGLRGNLYYGKSLMPLYNIRDMGGNKYGNTLYFGDPFYRVNDDGTFGVGFYNRSEAYYDLNVSDFLKLRVTAAFHFTHKGYAGCQQMVRLVFNLEELISRNK